MRFLVISTSKPHCTSSEPQKCSSSGGFLSLCFLCTFLAEVGCYDGFKSSLYVLCLLEISTSKPHCTSSQLHKILVLREIFFQVCVFLCLLQTEGEC